MDREIPPPANMAVWHEHRPVLYRADGMALVRTAGFIPAGERMAIQTSGTCPKLTQPKPPKKGGKRGR